MRMRVRILLGLWLAGLPLAATAEEAPSYAALHVQTPPFSATQPAIDQQNSLDQLAQRYNTPKSIAAFLKQSFTFSEDQQIFGERDRWQAPEEFLIRKVGDCEDYALLAKALLERNGLQAFVFSVYGEEGYAHTVAVFVDGNGQYNLLNQDRVRFVKATSLTDLASQIYPAWTYAAAVERDGTQGRAITELFNDSPASSFAEDLSSY